MPNPSVNIKFEGREKDLKQANNNSQELYSRLHNLRMGEQRSCMLVCGDTFLAKPNLVGEGRLDSLPPTFFSSNCACNNKNPKNLRVI